jgi:putative transposase
MLPNLAISASAWAMSMAAVGKPEENGLVERLMRTIREEEIGLSEYRDFADAYGLLGRFLHEVAAP